MAAELKIRRGSVAVELWVDGSKQFEIDLPRLKFEELLNIRIVIDDHKPALVIEHAELETPEILEWYDSERGYRPAGAGGLREIEE